MARAARDAGYEVHVATRVVDGGAAIAAEGFTLHPLNWRRGSTNPIDFISAIAEVRRVYRALTPDLVHQVAFWPSIVGSLAAFGLADDAAVGARRHGLRLHVECAEGAHGARAAAEPFLRHLLSGPQAAVLVQNPDDQRRHDCARHSARDDISSSPAPASIPTACKPLPEPPAPITMAYVGRLLDDKGLRTLIAAQALLAARGETIRLLIAGETDPANPASIPPAEIDSLAQAAIDRAARPCAGHRRRLGAGAYRGAAVAPRGPAEKPAGSRRLRPPDRRNRRAGLPRDRARRASMRCWCRLTMRRRLPMLCRRLARDPGLRAKFGAAGRALVEREFSSARVGAETVKLYRAMLSSSQSTDSHIPQVTIAMTGSIDAWTAPGSD